MTRLKWQRIKQSQYDIVYQLYSPSGSLVAEVYRGGSKWYPWSWYMKDDSGRHGDSLTMTSAKESAEIAYFNSIK